MNFFSPMMYPGGLMFVEKSLKVMGRKSKKMSSLKIETLLGKKTDAGPMFLKLQTVAKDDSKLVRILGRGKGQQQDFTSPAADTIAQCLKCKFQM